MNNVGIGGTPAKGKPSMQKIKLAYKQIEEGIESYKSIGREYGVSDNAVRKRFNRLGLDKITLQKDGKYVKCSHCQKEKYVQNNETKNRAGNDKRHFYCDSVCMGLHLKKKF